MNHDWLSYADVFHLSEYQCSVLENFDEFGNGYVRYGFYDNGEMITNLTVRFDVEFNIAQVAVLIVAPNYRNLGIGKRIAYGLYNFAIKCGWRDKRIIIKNSFLEQSPPNSSEPFASAITGSEIDLTDKNTLYMQWREEYAQEMGFANP